MLSAVAPIVVALAASVAPQPPAQDGLPPVELAIAYDDGRVVRYVVNARSSIAWTPLFPRAAEWRSADGLRVEAIHYRHRLDGNGVRVTVSLLLGPFHQREVNVTDVIVARDQPVVVRALEPFGVRPVRLSVSDYVPTALYQPAVENRTTALQIESIDTVTTDRPGYRILVRNLSLQPVLAFAVQASSGGKPALGSRIGERDGTPILRALGTHTFVLPSRRSLDLLSVTGLMFEDGSIEGDAATIADMKLLYLGRRTLLAQALTVLEPAAQARLAEAATVIPMLGTRIAALPALPDAQLRREGATLVPAGSPFSAAAIESHIAAGMSDARRGIERDLRDAPREPHAFQQWLREITALYRKWHDRFATLTRQ